MEKFALIGNPLGHSLSPVIHKAGFESLGVDAQYELLETDDLVGAIKHLKANDYKGFNVTIPYKLPVAMFVDGVDMYADFAHAINTVKIEEDKTMRGYNTDVIGFLSALPPGFAAEKAAILGTGGAAHAAAVAFAQLKVKEITFFTRNIPNSIEKIKAFRERFPNTLFNILSIEHLSNLSTYSILVNATPVGMLGHSADQKPLSTHTLSTLGGENIVYDLVYNPHKTVLIKEAQKLGFKTINGLDMLVHQAVAAQKIWFGKEPEFNAMKVAALEALI